MAMVLTSPPFPGWRVAHYRSFSFSAVAATSSPSSSATNRRIIAAAAAASSLPEIRRYRTSCAAVADTQTRERERLKELFREARQRCLDDPIDGVSFTLQDFLSALDHYELDPRLGTPVHGTVLTIDDNGAIVDIMSKSHAYLPVEEASTYKVKHVAEAGLYPGLEEEFVIIGQRSADGSLIISRRSLLYHFAWERCLQLQSEDAIVIGKVVGQNKGGVTVNVEGLYGFLPCSEISVNSEAEQLVGKKLWLKLIEVDEEQSRLVLSNRKAEEEHEPQIQAGSVVIGLVKTVKPYGVFVDVGGVDGLLHVSQISQKLVVNIATILHPGDKVKVMILSYDRERGQLSLSTKKLEPTPGDMIRNPELVFEKAEEMARIFRERVARAGEIACCGMQNTQPKLLGTRDL